jgi:dipeptidyl aminopeptidase/acylaminoacyl peptidase
LCGRAVRRRAARFYIKPHEFDFFAGSWSPSGNKMLLVARVVLDRRRDLGRPRGRQRAAPVPIAPSCGGALWDPTSISCSDPRWSPDGTKIVFTGVTANGTQPTSTGVNADGSGLVQVTRGRTDSLPDRGPHHWQPSEQRDAIHSGRHDRPVMRDIVCAVGGHLLATENA